MGKEYQLLFMKSSEISQSATSSNATCQSCSVGLPRVVDKCPRGTASHLAIRVQAVVVIVCRRICICIKFKKIYSFT